MAKKKAARKRKKAAPPAKKIAVPSLENYPYGTYQLRGQGLETVVAVSDKSLGGLNLAFLYEVSAGTANQFSVFGTNPVAENIGSDPESAGVIVMINVDNSLRVQGAAGSIINYRCVPPFQYI
jgi:hypothetical protein